MDKLNKNANNILKNITSIPRLNLIVYSLLVILAVFVIPTLSYSSLSLLNNLGIRLISILIISFVCLHDPITALLLAICLVLGIQRLQKLKGEYSNNLINSNSNLDSNTLSEEDNTNYLMNNNVDGLMNNNIDTNMNVNENNMNINNNMNLNNNMNNDLNNDLNTEVKHNMVNAVNIGNLLEDNGINGLNHTDKVIENFSNENNHTHTDAELHESNNHNHNHVTPANELNYENVSSEIPVIDEVSGENNINLNNLVPEDNLSINNQNSLNNLNMNEVVNDLVNNNVANNNANNTPNLQDLDDAYNQPAFKTITENVLNNIPCNDSDNHMSSIQSHKVCSGNYSSQIKTFNDQHDIQGLDFPKGIPGTSLMNTSASFN